jgi:hypothetical protein
MSLDAKQSLIAAGSVILLFTIFWMTLPLLDGVYLPNWVLPLALIVMTIDFGWRLVRWLRAKRGQSEEPPHSP